MKIAIITSGLLPVPAVSGGAIETLIDNFIKQNEIEKKTNIDIYSIYNLKSKKIINKNEYKYTKYIYINPLGNMMLKVINKIFKKNIQTNLLYQKEILKIINKKQYDYIIIENYPELVLNINSTKIIPYIHSDVFNIETKNAKEILSKSYKVISVSDFIKKRIIEIDKKQENKVYTVYNSIDFGNIENDDYEIYRKEYRGKYHIGKEDFVFCYSGRISPEKGVLELVRAFKKSNIQGSKLLLVGGIWYGCNKSNDYLEKIKKEANKNTIFAGYVTHKEMNKLLCATDVGVVPSICNEAAGLSVVEFMNTGNIVVASNMGGIGEYLNKEDNYLVDYRNTDQFINDLSDTMKKTYDEKIKNERIKKSNIIFSRKFSVSENYNEVIKVLKER